MKLEWPEEGRTSLRWAPHEEEVPVRGIGELLEDPLDHAGPRVLDAGPFVDILEALEGLLVTDALYQVSGVEGRWEFSDGHGDVTGLRC